MRHDETGFGLDLSGSLPWSAPALGLVSGHGLLTYEDAAFYDCEVAASLSYSPPGLPIWACLLLSPRRGRRSHERRRRSVGTPHRRRHDDGQPAPTAPTDHRRGRTRPAVVGRYRQPVPQPPPAALHRWLLLPPRHPQPPPLDPTPRSHPNHRYYHRPPQIKPVHHSPN